MSLNTTTLYFVYQVDMFRPTLGHPQVHKQFKKNTAVKCTNSFPSVRPTQCADVSPYNIQNTKHTIYSCPLQVSWCYIQRGFQMMTAMTESLAILMEVTTGYNKLNSCCKSSN